MSEPKPIYEFGEFRLNVEEKQLRRLNGEIVALSPKTFELLTCLVENHGHLLTKNELLDKVWTDSFVEEGNLKLNIHALRQILPKTFIETVPKHGYRFAGEVKELNQINFNQNISAQNISVRQTAIPTVIEGQSVINQQTIVLTEEAAKTVALSLNKQVRKQTFIYSAFALIFIGLIGLSAYYFWKTPETETSQVKTIAEIPSHSIAVLPFKNLTADAQDDFLSVGLTDALITKLSGISRLAVRPTTSVMPFTDEQNAAAIGEKLKVENILEGTIQRSGGRLRISARLIRIADNTVLWSKNFDEDSSDFLDFQDAVSVQIANTLLSNLSRDEQNTLARRETENPEAFALYLKGQYFLSRRSSKDLPKALDFFEKASEADRNFSLAYIGVARTYAILGDSGWGILPPDVAFEKARAALQKASEINPDSAEILSTLATIQTNYDWNLPKAEENFRRALEINPNFAAAHHQFGWMKIAEKKYAEAEAEFKRALELDPTSPILTTEIGYPAFFAKDYAAAEKYFRKALEFDENSIPAQFNLWRVLHHQAKYAEASDTIATLENLVDKRVALLLVCKARTLHRAGKTFEAEQIFKNLVERKNTGEKISPNFMAILAAELEKRDETFAYLDESIKERNSYILHLNHAPEFENFRNDPRFAEMLAKIKP